MRPFAASIVAASFTWIASLALVGCSGSADEGAASSGPSDVTSGSDVTDVESNTLSIASSITGGTADGSSGLTLASQTALSGGSSGVGEISAQALGDAAKAYYRPAGCLVVTDDTSTSTATYVFTDCTGPHGLVTVNGTLTVAYSAPSSTELKVSFSIDQPFTITGARGRQAVISDWAASADVTASGTDLATRTLDWSGRLSGTTRRGIAFDHSSTWQVSWTVGGDCITESGTSTGQIGALSVATTVSDYQVCADTCPAAGSEITIIDSTDGLKYDLEYGTDTATYTGPLGKKYTYMPLCAE